MLIVKTIGSVIEFVPKIISDILDELALKVPLDQKERLDLNLILEEAITNAIRHGNQLDTSRKVKITLKVKDNVLTMQIEDEGKGFAYKNLPDNVKAANTDLNSHGRGLFLISKLADQVSFNLSGSEICITKKIRTNK